MDDPRLCVTVQQVEREGDQTRVSMRISAGIRSVGAPAAGTERSFGPPAPDWFQITRQRKQFGARLAVTPWTHDGVATPESEPVQRAVPADLLVAVEALR